jgi:hypothetical protein
MAERDLYDVCNLLLGSEIEEIEVDAEDEIIYIQTSNGMIRIEGYDLSMYAETDMLDS